MEKRRSGDPLAADAEANVSLVDWLEREPEQLADDYRRLFVPRNDGRYLQRNALVALGNAGREGDRQLTERYLEGEDPLLREYAAWACGRLDERRGDA